jgi:hypothetical protein
MPKGNEFTVSLPLTTMVLDRMKQYAGTMVATDIFPEIPVARPSGQFWNAGIEMLRSEKTERAPGTIGGMSNRSGSWVTYKTQQYSWASPITDEERIEAKDNPGIDLESERADDCLATVLLAREVRAAALLAAAASYEAANIKACPADARWNNHTGADHDLVRDIRVAIQALLPLRADAIIAPARCQIASWGTPSLTEFFKYVDGPAYLNGGGLWGPKFMGLDVITPDATKLSNAKGATDAVTNVYADSVQVIVRGKRLGNRVFGGWGCSFVYPGASNLVSETWGGFSDTPELTKFVRVRDKGRQEKILNTLGAYTLTGVLGE